VQENAHAELGVVLDDRARRQYAVIRDRRVYANHHPRTDNQVVTETRGWGDAGQRMYRGNQTHSSASEQLGDSNARLIVADCDDCCLDAGTTQRGDLLQTAADRQTIDRGTVSAGIGVEKRDRSVTLSLQEGVEHQAPQAPGTKNHHFRRQSNLPFCFYRLPFRSKGVINYGRGVLAPAPPGSAAQVFPAPMEIDHASIRAGIADRGELRTSNAAGKEYR
jgi:hypothetical protein